MKTIRQNTRLQAILQATTLFGFALYFTGAVISGAAYRYVHERHIPMLLFSAVVFFLLLLSATEPLELAIVVVLLPDLPPDTIAIITITTMIAINHGLVKIGFLFFAPQLGHTLADFAISLPQVLQVVILLLLIFPPD